LANKVVYNKVYPETAFFAASCICSDVKRQWSDALV